MKKELLNVYKYFSHNLRTCTSTIVATLEALKMGLIGTDSDEMQHVYESSYIIDILDVSFSICLDYILNKSCKLSEYDLNINQLIERFLAEQKQLILLHELNVDVRGTQIILSKNTYVIKYFLQLILFETIKNAMNNLEIILENNSVRFILDEAKDEPNEIFSFFSDILKQGGTAFYYEKNQYVVEF